MNSQRKDWNKIEITLWGIIPRVRAVSLPHLAAEGADEGGLDRVLPQHVPLELALVDEADVALVAAVVPVLRRLGRVVDEQLVLLGPPQRGEALPAEAAHDLAAALAVHRPHVDLGEVDGAEHLAAEEALVRPHLRLPPRRGQRQKVRRLEALRLVVLGRRDSVVLWCNLQPSLKFSDMSIN